MGSMGSMDSPVLSLALAGLDLAGLDALAPGERLRAQLTFARSLGLRSVHLNAAAAGLRARELSRSARRDLASLLRRSELALTGLDLWIAPDHFLLPEHQDRAVNATLDAIELAGELSALIPPPSRGAGAGIAGPNAARVVLSLSLPRALAADLHTSLAQRADTHNVLIADHTSTPATSSGSAWPVPDERFHAGPIGVGIDPASIYMSGADPIALAAKIGSRAASARLSDVSSSGRCAPGGSRAEPGRLDPTLYAITLNAVAYAGAVVLDPRQVREPERTLGPAVDRWTGAARGA